MLSYKTTGRVGLNLPYHHIRHTLLFKTIALALVCLFLVNDLSWATPDTLAPRAGNPQVYTAMREMMIDLANKTDLKKVEEFIRQNQGRAKNLLSSSSEFNQELKKFIRASDAEDMFVRLKSVLSATGGKLLVIDVNSVKELPKVNGKPVHGYAAGYGYDSENKDVVVFRVIGKDGAKDLIAKIAHEIRARSTAAKILFEKEFKRRKPATQEEIPGFIAKLQTQFEKTNEKIADEIRESGRIKSRSLREEFAGLTFAEKPQTMNRDYTMAEDKSAVDAKAVEGAGAAQNGPSPILLGTIRPESNKGESESAEMAQKETPGDAVRNETKRLAAILSSLIRQAKEVIRELDNMFEVKSTNAALTLTDEIKSKLRQLVLSEDEFKKINREQEEVVERYGDPSKLSETGHCNFLIAAVNNTVRLEMPVNPARDMVTYEDLSYWDLIDRWGKLDDLEKALNYLSSFPGNAVHLDIKECSLPTTAEARQAFYPDKIESLNQPIPAEKLPELSETERAELEHLRKIGTVIANFLQKNGFKEHIVKGTAGKPWKKFKEVMYEKDMRPFSPDGQMPSVLMGDEIFFFNPEGFDFAFNLSKGDLENRIQAKFKFIANRGVNIYINGNIGGKYTDIDVRDDSCIFPIVSATEKGDILELVCDQEFLKDEKVATVVPLIEQYFGVKFIPAQHNASLRHKQKKDRRGPLEPHKQHPDPKDESPVPPNDLTPDPGRPRTYRDVNNARQENCPAVDAKAAEGAGVAPNGPSLILPIPEPKDAINITIKRVAVGGDKPYAWLNIALHESDPASVRNAREFEIALNSIVHYEWVNRPPTRKDDTIFIYGKDKTWRFRFNDLMAENEDARTRLKEALSNALFINANAESELEGRFYVLGNKTTRIIRQTLRSANSKSSQMRSDLRELKEYLEKYFTKDSKFYNKAQDIYRQVNAVSEPVWAGNMSVWDAEEIVFKRVHALKWALRRDVTVKRDRFHSLFVQNGNRGGEKAVVVTIGDSIFVAKNEAELREELNRVGLELPPKVDFENDKAIKRCIEIAIRQFVKKKTIKQAETAKQAESILTEEQTVADVRAIAEQSSVIGVASRLIDEAWALVREAFAGVTADINIRLLAQAVNEYYEDASVISDRMIQDEKVGFIFSELATFGDSKDGDKAEGLGIILPELATRGVKVAVLLNNDPYERERQEKIINELNEKAGLSGKRVRFGTSVAEIRNKFSDYEDGPRPARFYHLKTKLELPLDEGFNKDENIILSINIVVHDILRILGRLCKIVPEGQEPDKLYEAAKKFAQAA